MRRFYMQFDQAKLVLELQRENSVLREQLVKQQQKLLTVRAQSLASNSSPQQHIATPCSTQRNVKRSILTGNCFNTSDSKRSAANNKQVRVMQRKVRALEAEIEKMKKAHIIQLGQKDTFIHDLINRNGSNCHAGTAERRVILLLEGNDRIQMVGP
jgi:kinesin family member 18/19